MAYNTAPSLNAMTGIFVALTMISVSARFFERKRQGLPWKLDDWSVIPATLFFLGAAVCTFWSIHIKQLGYSSFDVSREELASTYELAEKLGVAFNICVITALTFSKASALFLYRRIFCNKTHKRTMAILIDITLVVLFLWFIAFILLAGLECGSHLEALWNGNYNKYCGPVNSFVYGLTVSEFLLDLWVLSIPIPTVLKLHTTLVNKISIIGVFLLAYIGLGASIARLVIFTHNFQVGDRHAMDFLLSKSTSFFLIVLEAGISIVTVNLPAAWTIFGSFTNGKLFESIVHMISLRSILSSGNRQGSRDATGDDVEAQPDATAAMPNTSSRKTSVNS